MADQLPTVWEWISNWLGVQLPTIPMPQTVKNLDKAVSKLILESGENVEAHIRAGTGKVRAQGKIDVEGMFRTAEERRKFENRAKTTQVAIEGLRDKPGTADATQEIEDDWLNFFARLAEDKSSDEGMVAKRLADPYAPGITTWWKVLNRAIGAVRST